jgi:hypothetical protein
VLLYKYAGDSGIKILEELKLKVTPPNELNDPFEITPRSRHTMTRKNLSEKATNDPEHFRPIYEAMVAASVFTGSFSDLLEAYKTMPRKTYCQVRRLFEEQLVRDDLASINERSRLMVVLCFSAVNNSIPMWSHYANHHRGVVIGMETDDPCFGIGTGLHKVIYKRQRVSCNPMAQAEPRILQAEIGRIILTKSRDWEYEQEYRICFAKHAVIEPRESDPERKYFIHIWPEVIKFVILGCRISDTYTENIRAQLAQKKFSHVRLLKAQRHKHRFAIEVVPS